LQPDGDTGWHTHPGPLLVVVESGMLTHYDRRCDVQTYSAGQAFEEPAGSQHVHMGTNRTDARSSLKSPTPFPPAVLCVMRLRLRTAPRRCELSGATGRPREALLGYDADRRMTSDFYRGAVACVGGASSRNAQAGNGTPKAVVTRHAGTPITAARRMIAASSSSGIRAGASVASVLGAQSAVDTIVLTAQPNPQTDSPLDADADPRSRLEAPWFVVRGAHLAMRFELGAG